MTYGSLQNRVMEKATRGQPTPTVGMGATILLHSDRHAGTIIAVANGKNGVVMIQVQHDNEKVVAGSTHDGTAAYEFTPNTSGRVDTFRFDGVRWWEMRWNDETKRFNKCKHGHGLRIGERDSYYDPTF